MAYNYGNTWQATQKLAGQSSGREVRHVVQPGKLIVPGPFAFMNLMGEKGMGDDGKIKKVMPTISMSDSPSLSPELYDWEVQPDQFALQAAVAGHATIGASVVWTLNQAKGIAVGEVLNKVDQGIRIRVTAVDTSLLTATGTVYYNSSGDDTATADTSVARIEKMAGANTDAFTVNDGVSREPTNRTNKIQTMYSALAVGILHDKQKLYGQQEEAGAYFKEEKKRMLIDLYRQMESVAMAGQQYTEGSGSTLRYYTDGLEGLSETTIYNDSLDGSCSEDAFLDKLELAFEAGGGDKAYFLCDVAFKRMVMSYSRFRKRITDNSKTYSTDIEEWDTPLGTVVLVPSQFLNKPARRGSAISIFPNLIKGYNLRGLPLTWMEDLNIPNVMVFKGAYIATLGFLANNPASISTWTNFKQ